MRLNFGIAGVVAGDVADLSPSLALARTDVGLVEESGEEDKVAEIHGQGQFDVEPRDVTLLLALLQVLGRPDVDGTPHDHLRQLTRRDHHGDTLPRVIAHGAQRVVRVHDGVHAVVHDDVPAGGRRVLCIGEPGVQQHGDVVVPVQEDEGLFAQHDEHCVAQLGQLGQHKQERPAAGHTVMFDKAWNTYRMVEPIISHNMY